MKKEFKQKRDGLQQFIYKIINPVVKGMIRMGMTPNTVSSIGFIGSVAATVMFVCAAHCTAHSFGLIGWGGAVIILFSLFDMLDGQVARLGGMVSTFGAMYDSVLDRYSELLTLGGISYFLIMTSHPVGALVTFIALVGSVMVSYVRARAEGLGIECKIGLMQRPERVVLTSIAAIACGIVGASVSSWKFDAAWILTIAMAIIAIFANVTAIARVCHCHKELAKKKQQKP